MPAYAKERAAAARAVELASTVCAEVFRSLDRDGEVNVKTDNSPVTVADYASQAIIIYTIRKEFPDALFVGEEDACLLRDPSAEVMRRAVTALVRKVYPGLSTEEVLNNIDLGSSEGGGEGDFWVLDPIDGTKGFIGGRQYAVCLGLIVDGVAVLGVLGCPNYSPLSTGAAGEGGEEKSSCCGRGQGSLFVAVTGQGAFMRRLGGREHGAGSSGEVDQKGASCHPMIKKRCDPDASARTPSDDDAVLRPTNIAECAVTETPISVSTVSRVGDAVFCESFESGHSSHALSGRVAQHLRITAAPRRMDSQCKYAAVACGSISGIDAYLRPPPLTALLTTSTETDTQAEIVGRHENIWDHVAGSVVVTEAGGSVTDLRGLPLDFSRGRALSSNTGVVCSGGGVLHASLIAALTRHI